jgi:hypothetical protein
MRQRRLITLGNRTPHVAVTAWVAPSAVVAGDVDIGDRVRPPSMHAAHAAPRACCQHLPAPAAPSARHPGCVRQLSPARRAATGARAAAAAPRSRGVAGGVGPATPSPPRRRPCAGVHLERRRPAGRPEQHHHRARVQRPGWLRHPCCKVGQTSGGCGCRARAARAAAAILHLPQGSGSEPRHCVTRDQAHCNRNAARWQPRDRSQSAGCPLRGGGGGYPRGGQRLMPVAAVGSVLPLQVVPHRPHRSHADRAVRFHRAQQRPALSTRARLLHHRSAQRPAGAGTATAPPGRGRKQLGQHATFEHRSALRADRARLRIVERASSCWRNALPQPPDSRRCASTAPCPPPPPRPRRPDTPCPLSGTGPLTPAGGQHDGALLQAGARQRAAPRTPHPRRRVVGRQPGEVRRGAPPLLRMRASCTLHAAPPPGRAHEDYPQPSNGPLPAPTLDCPPACGSGRGWACKR